MNLKEKFPKNVSFYLEENKKSNFNSAGFIFLDEQLNAKAGIFSEKGQKQNSQKNNFDVLREKIQFRYYHPDFLKKANELIKEDKQKEGFLSFINAIYSGYKNYYANEKLRINNNFIYSSFSAKEPKLKLKINFCLFFEKTPRKIPYNTYIQKIFFFDICKEKDLPEKKLSKKLSEFEQNYRLNNNDLEFDKMIYLGEMKEKIFCEFKDSDDLYVNNPKDYYFAFPFEIKTRNEIFKKCIFQS